MAEGQAFTVTVGKDGAPYYSGALLDEGLFNHKPGAFSVYAFVGGAARHLGAKRLPDMKFISANIAGTVGTPDFGVPRVPPEHRPKALPVELLDKFWNPVRNLLVVSVKAPGHWPFSLGLAAQQAMIKAKDVIDPGIAAYIVMEAAIAMARIDPGRVRNAYLSAG
jgi:hypothetical protein